MKLIYRAEHLIDAHLVRHALEQAGIDCLVSGEYSTGALGELPALGLVGVMVADDDVAEASRVAAEVSARLAAGDYALDDDFDADAVIDAAT